MSIRIVRNAVFIVDGDGTSTVMKINLKEHLESVSLVGGFSPSGVENASFKSIRNAVLTTINSITVQDFIVTVTLATAPASDPQFGYALTLGLLFEGAV